MACAFLLAKGWLSSGRLRPQDHRHHSQRRADAGLDKTQEGIDHRVDSRVQAGNHHDYRHGERGQTGVVRDADELAQKHGHPDGEGHAQGAEGQQEEVDAADDRADGGAQQPQPGGGPGFPASGLEHDDAGNQRPEPAQRRARDPKQGRQIIPSQVTKQAYQSVLYCNAASVSGQHLSVYIFPRSLRSFMRLLKSRSGSCCF